MNVHTPLLPSQATIDSGRLLTLERRANFRMLYVSIYDHRTDLEETIPNDYILSERRIVQVLRRLDPRVWSDISRGAQLSLAGFTKNIADAVHYMMRDWCNAGYPETGVVVDSSVIGGYTVDFYTVRLLTAHPAL